ncbi:MAG: ABC1 kinase family protein, partial [Candidatus Hinthialibacter sp.]
MRLLLSKKNLTRYKQIATFLLKYGFSDLVFQSDFKDTLDKEELDKPVANSKAEEFPKDLENLGPTFIKFGQFLSMFTDFLPTAYQESLIRLQDKVEPFDFSDVETIVANDLGLTLASAYQEFDRNPISAASIGQVHKARLRNGTLVAVKVQRPNIRSQILSDLEILQYIAYLLDRNTDYGQYAHFETLSEEFRKSILRELDFRLEAQNLQILGKNLKEYSRIRIPQPVEAYTGTQVLTMEFIDGIKVSDISSLSMNREQRIQLAEDLFQGYLKQILIDGFFHADPHPGNVLITHDQKVSLLDLGMAAQINDDMQDSLLKILSGISTGDGHLVVNEALKISETTPKFNESRFSHDVCDLIAYQQHRTASDYNMGKVALEITKISNKNGVLIPTEVTILGKTLLNLDQVGRQLAPEFNPNDCIQRNAVSLTQERLLKSFSPASILNSLLETKELIGKMPHRINRILDSLANNEIEFKVDAIDEKTLITGFQKIANRIMMGLIIAALIVGSALLMQLETPFMILGYPVIAVFF